MIEQCAPGFSCAESLARGRRHLLSQLVCFGRHTITGLLRNQDRTQQDWTADYRFYSRDRLDEDKVFGQIRVEIEKGFCGQAPLVVAMDDSLLRKTGRRIYGARFQRDPLSPPFHVNFVRGLRVLQISAAVTQGTQGAARMIPIDFQHAALPAKPRKDAGPQLQAAYEQERAKRNINLVGRQRLCHLRQQMDQSGSAGRALIATIDGRFTNSTVLSQVPERTTLIGRVRKDSAFYFPAQQQAQLGRKRKYGAHCPTPEELLNDTTQAPQTVWAYAAGKRYEFSLKTLGPVYSQMDKAAQALRLVVIEPVPYRLSRSSKLEKREPAFLICTDPQLPLEQIVQCYLWRWDIEVNFRDEKTILGVGEAQVRSEASNQNAPALAVAAYSLLLLGGLRAYGAQGKPETFKRPRWYNRDPEQRATTNELINQLRYELWSAALNTHFRPFSSTTPPHQSGRKCDPSLHSAIFCSIK
ncbi:MAG TPA: transposase [Candidatus Saccharimonadia bacterium]|nr:transposase [Candidatus Saccharimonadia bacterium]